MAFSTTYLLSIDHTQCGSASSSSFAVLVKVTTTTSIKTVANGGEIQHTGTQTGGAAGTIPYDLVFSSDAAGSSKYPWEIESYDGSAGTLVAWVKIPTVSNSSDTVFYMNYGDSSISTQQNTSSLSPANVWDSNYKSVWHFTGPSGGTLSALESTSAGNNGSTSAVSAGTGKIDGCGVVTADFQGLCGASDTGFPTGNSDRTISCWINTTLSSSSAGITIYNYGTPAAGNGHWVALQLKDPGILVSGYAVDTTVTYSWAANTWIYLVLTVSSTTAQVYINGATQGSSFSVSGWNTLLNGTSLVGQLQSFGAWWRGSIDEVRVSNNARSASWILTEYNNQNNPGNIGSAGFLTFTPIVSTISASDTITLSDSILLSRINSFSDTITLSDAISTLNNGLYRFLLEDYLNLQDLTTNNFGPFPPNVRGNIDYDQIRISARTGDGSKFLTFKGSFTAGHTIIFDADGNAIDSGHT